MIDRSGLNKQRWCKDCDYSSSYSSSPLSSSPSSTGRALLFGVLYFFLFCMWIVQPDIVESKEASIVGYSLIPPSRQQLCYFSSNNRFDGEPNTVFDPACRDAYHLVSFQNQGDFELGSIQFMHYTSYWWSAKGDETPLKPFDHIPNHICSAGNPNYNGMDLIVKWSSLPIMLKERSKITKSNVTGRYQQQQTSGSNADTFLLEYCIDSRGSFQDNDIGWQIYLSRTTKQGLSTTYLNPVIPENLISIGNFSFADRLKNRPTDGCIGGGIIVRFPITIPQFYIYKADQPIVLVVVMHRGTRSWISCSDITLLNYNNTPQKSKTNSSSKKTTNEGGPEDDIKPPKKSGSTTTTTTDASQTTTKTTDNDRGSILKTTITTEDYIYFVSSESSKPTPTPTQKKERKIEVEKVEDEEEEEGEYRGDDQTTQRSLTNSLQSSSSFDSYEYEFKQTTPSTPSPTKPSQTPINSSPPQSYPSPSKSAKKSKKKPNSTTPQTTKKSNDSKAVDLLIYLFMGVIGVLVIFILTSNMRFFRRNPQRRFIESSSSSSGPNNL